MRLFPAFLASQRWDSRQTGLCPRPRTMALATLRVTTASTRAGPHPRRSVGIDSHRFWRAALVPPASGEPRPRGVTRPGPGAKDPGIGVLRGPLMGSAWKATPSVAPTPGEAAAGPLAATHVERPSWDSRGCFGNWPPGAASSSPTGARRGSLPVVTRGTKADPAGPGDVLSVGTGVGQLGW